MNTKTSIAIAAVTVGSLVAGFSAGVIFTKKRLEKLINEELEEINKELELRVAQVRAEYEGDSEPTGDEQAAWDAIQTPYVGVREGTSEEEEENEAIAALYNKPEVLTPEEDTAFAESAPFTVDDKEPSDILNVDPNELNEDEVEDSKAAGERFVRDLVGDTDNKDPKADTVDPEEDHTSTTLVLTQEQVERITTGPIQITTKNAFKDYKDEEPTELEKLQAELERDENGTIIQQLPYVIPINEYMNGDDEGLELLTLWWYAGDGTLVDEREIPIPDVEGIIGRANLDHFGVGSDDSRVLYVRNNKMKAAFEILLHDGNYAEVVFGVGSQNEKKRSPQKMRKSDE